MVHAATRATRRSRYTPEQRAERARQDADLFDRAAQTLAGDPRVIRDRIRQAVAGMSPRILGYSLRNQTLLFDQAAQRGMTLTDVDTFRGWKRRGRSVRKGEHGLRIIRPVGIDDQATGNDDQEDDERPADSDAAPRVRFRVMVVFERSQTDPVGQATGEDQDCPACGVTTGEPCRTGCACPACATEPETTGTPGEVLWNNLYEQITRAGYAFDWPADVNGARVSVDHDARAVRVALSATPDDPDALADIAAALAEIITCADQRRTEQANQPRQLPGIRPALTASSAYA